MKKGLKKIMCASLAGAMVLSMAACGSKPAADPKPAETKAPETEAAAEGEAEVLEDGKVLNIYCWNDEFQRRMISHYDGYEVIDATTGKIGDVEVRWNITPSDDNAYQNNLDQTLLNMDSAAANDKIDMFLIEADYALKYTDTDFTAAIADLGITEDEIADQFQYTKDIVTANGVLKGLSWQGCPGVLFYNREAAKEVLGSDDPETVQAAVADWDAFVATADKMNAAGYQVVSSVNDTYRVYSDNVTSPWVVDGKINIDDNIVKWVEDSKKLVDAGCTGTFDLWGDDWSKGFFPEGKVFSYFGPAWLINFCMAADQEGSIANLGGWGAVVGPQGFSWGGTWIAAVAGTDNADLIADIMRQLTCDAENMKQIVIEDDDFVNNIPAMEEMAADETYASSVLGGINPLQMYLDGAVTIDKSNISSYDQGCTEEFQHAMKNYFDGNATYEEALDLFKKAIVEKYPDLVVE